MLQFTPDRYRAFPALSAFVYTTVGKSAIFFSFLFVARCTEGPLRMKNGVAHGRESDLPMGACPFGACAGNQQPPSPGPSGWCLAGVC
jgi:hypothetical protein